jgi:hypothetical protein
MLFVILAAVMFVTRNVDWYRRGAEVGTPKIVAPRPPIPRDGMTELWPPDADGPPAITHILR